MSQQPCSTESASLATDNAEFRSARCQSSGGLASRCYSPPRTRPQATALEAERGTGDSERWRRNVLQPLSPRRVNRRPHPRPEPADVQREMKLALLRPSGGLARRICRCRARRAMNLDVKCRSRASTQACLYSISDEGKTHSPQEPPAPLSLLRVDTGRALPPTWSR